MLRYFLWALLNVGIVVCSFAMWIGGIALVCLDFIGLGIAMTIAGITFCIASVDTAIHHTW